MAFLLFTLINFKEFKMLLPDLLLTLLVSDKYVTFIVSFNASNEYPHI